MTPTQALWSLHADYIGGEHANYRIWYFAAQLDLDTRPQAGTTCHTKSQLLEQAKSEWHTKMVEMSDQDRMAQLILYLLIWGEASTLRYMPELLCFIFKTADDNRQQLDMTDTTTTSSHRFLNDIITPLYRFVRDQSYIVVDGQCVRREKDHNDIIGYDDMNQFFWDRQTMAKLVLTDGLTLLNNIPLPERYTALPHVDWSLAFRKTFYESRSWLHLFTNFSRFWILHIAIFWYYMTANMGFLFFEQKLYTLPVKMSVVALGGLVALILMIASTLTEFHYLPLSSRISKILVARLCFLAFFAAGHVGACFYVLYIDRDSWIALVVSSCQLGLGAIITIALAIVPSSRLFRFKSQPHLATQAFTAHFPAMPSNDRSLSILMWMCVFVCKFLETYFFQAMSFRDAITAMVTMKMDNCRRDPLLGTWMCGAIHAVASILMFSVELVLFFLDTYLWYVIWNTVFSVSQAMQMGISIMTSWRTMFARLPGNMYTKITSTQELATSPLRKMACCQMWNAIVISMYREHLLSVNNLHWLMYKIYNKTSDVDDEYDGDGNSSNGTTIHNSLSTRRLAVPAIFDLDNNVKKVDCFPAYSEAERRLSFFAQSLSTDIPPPCSVQQMPTFTVFTPHYAEKTLLSLREIIREEDTTTRVTLLEYLKRLHPAEWKHFVKDTKFIAEDNEEGTITGDTTRIITGDMPPTARSFTDKDDLPFYCIGFKSSAPEYTLRTRVWASLRAQTLYRTVSGFMNYARALKILHRIEHPELSDPNSGGLDDTEAHLDQLAQHKFRFLVAMQRYAKFSDEENANCEYLLTEFPHLQIAYIEETWIKDNSNDDDGGEHGKQMEPIYYSCLIDGSCPKLANKRRQPRCRVRLPGNPILGDGKSDNQNHAIIFSRGEYLQLVDANQDNYLEECLKIRSIFREFEQDQPPTRDVYAFDGNNTSSTTSTTEQSTSTHESKDGSQPPVAIVGAREYIFSENVGVLGDIAAGKEQTFGTLTQRIMAKTGGRLHYGHPDFLNAVFMTTRGGVSKAQRGLHLNEDIYAGMNALSRGGRIKHTEYLQCGKGRDLGFCSILNFTTKIGAGMGEQLLSREYYYLGTQLPMDRFLTFYYAHPGFHMNNIMVIFAVQVFLFCMTVVGAMAISLPKCSSLDLLSNSGCFHGTPIYDWLRRCILSIFMVFFIAFLPLFLQELTEKGTGRSLLRLAKQLLSLSLFFEVFVTQVYANAVLSNLSFGGARYIATGRGFATSRLPFSVLYSRFANPSIYFGARTMIMLLFVSLAVWIPHLIYFWATVSSLIFSPFIFNPHQFVWTEFIVDYRHFLSWFTKGNARHSHEDAWITYCRHLRTRVIGTKQQKAKKKHRSGKSDKEQSTMRSKALPTSISPKARLASIFVSEIFMPLVQAVLCLVMYTFNKSHGHLPMGPGGALARVGLIAVVPIACHAIVLACVHIVTLIIACCGSSGGSMGRWTAAVTHSMGVLIVIAGLEYFWWLEHYGVQSTLLGILAIFSLQRFIFKTFVAMFLTRELTDDAANRAWWAGNWRETKLGRYALREYVCKIVEMSVFTTDFILGHLILFTLFPITCIPYIDRLHSLILFWLRPSHQIRPSVLSTKQRQRRNQIILWYGPLFILMLFLFVSLLVVPLLFWKPLLPKSTYIFMASLF